MVVRDGTRIAVDYFRPATGGVLHEEPLPVVWSHTRYQRSNITDGKLFTSLDHHPPLFTVLRHGYVIAIADVRGAGASYGTKHGWFPPEEAEDAHDLTEWFAEQPWSNGRVGMMNRSYLGITQYFNASQAPPHLACIFPEVAWIDEYDFIYPGGIFLDWPAYSWSIMVEAADRSAALPENWRTIVAENRVREADASPYAGTDYVTAAPEGGDPGGPVVPVDEDVDGHFLAEATAEHKASVPGHAIGVDLPFRDSVDAHTGAAYHEQRSLYGRLADIARSKVPAYHLGGWFDGFARDTLLWFRNYPNEQKLVMGPWFHGGITGINMPAEYLRWFDRWLKQVDNHVLDEASMHYWRLKFSGRNGVARNRRMAAGHGAAPCVPLPRRPLRQYRVGQRRSARARAGGESRGGCVPCRLHHFLGHRQSLDLDRWRWHSSGDTEAAESLSLPGYAGQRSPGPHVHECAARNRSGGHRSSGGAPVGDIDRQRR